jgi:hypothetical protein
MRKACNYLICVKDYFIMRKIKFALNCINFDNYCQFYAGYVLCDISGILRTVDFDKVWYNNYLGGWHQVKVFVL